jgi:hypothetical protein
MTFKERFAEFFAEQETAYKVSIYNEYAYATGNEPLNYIGEFEVICNGFNLIDLACKVHYGDFNPNYDYFTFDGYANLESVEDADYWLEDYVDDMADLFKDYNLCQLAEVVGEDVNFLSVSFEEMTEEDLWSLREEVVLGSIYTADFINSFGFDAHDVQDFFDNYCDVLNETAKEHGGEWTDYDSKESLWSYFLSADTSWIRQE